MTFVMLKRLFFCAIIGKMNDRQLIAQENNFDFLRFIAAVLVIYFHSTLLLSGT